MMVINHMLREYPKMNVGRVFSTAYIRFWEFFGTGFQPVPKVCNHV